MFLRKTGATNRKLTFAVIYSVLQKSLRGNFLDLALEMVKEFKKYPNALKRRLIQNVCEDVADMNLANAIYESPALIDELVKFVPIICNHIKCREGIWAFRVAVEYPDDNSEITSNDDLLRMSIKEKSRIRANDVNYLLNYFKNNVHPNIKQIYNFVSKNRNVLDGCVAYLACDYTHVSLPPLTTPEGFDINEVKNIVIPDFMYDKHTGSFAKDKHYSFYLNNMVIAPRLPESSIEKLARRLYLERNKRTRELMGVNPSSVPRFPELDGDDNDGDNDDDNSSDILVVGLTTDKSITDKSITDESITTNSINDESITTSSSPFLLQTQLITSKYKPKTFYCSFDNGKTYPYILKKGMKDKEFEALKVSDNIKAICGIRQTHIRKYNDDILMDNFITDIDPTKTVHKKSKIEEVDVYDGDKHNISKDTIKDDNLALSILKSLAFRKIVGTNDTCDRNIVIISKTEVASIDDPALFRNYQETIFKKKLPVRLAADYNQALTNHWDELYAWLTRCHDILDSKYTFSIDMCNKLMNKDYWKF